MFGSKQRRIEWLERRLSEAEADINFYRQMYDKCYARNCGVEKELRVTNKACRDKRKLSKALHEANKKIKELTSRLHDPSTWYTSYVYFIKEEPPAPMTPADVSPPNCA